MAERGSSSLPHPSFTFGGKSGTVISTVALQKVSRMPNGTSSVQLDSVNEVRLNGTTGRTEPLFICIDVCLHCLYLGLD